MSDFLRDLTIDGSPAEDLPDASDVLIPLSGVGPAYAVLANPAGACAQVRAAWGVLESQYDALLAANPSATGPSDRRILLTRVRQWLRTGLEFREAGPAAVTSFRVLSGITACWEFSQQGVRWSVVLELGAGNEVTLTWRTDEPPGEDAELMIRPDLENRSFHEVTRAFTGPENTFRAAVGAITMDGFTFATGDGPALQVRMPGALFKHEPDWYYQAPLPVETERGLSTATDLFSPGTFTWRMTEQREVSLRARAEEAPSSKHTSSRQASSGQERSRVLAGDLVEDTISWPVADALPAAMKRALDLFLARRDGEWTVIAGFPWFLDWGRDTLIFVRGLIAAGRIEESAAIIRRFAAWEEGGSIPNIIRGCDASNRETSDAPLWLVLAVRDLARIQPDILTQRAGARTVRQIVCDLVASHISGTSHGVQFDAASGLLWSPSHFTWMDTNEPAGTPREGYPVEIQALWAAALEFAHSLDPARSWGALAGKVRGSLTKLFWREGDGFLADCLHGPRGTTAAAALRDDHLRPNQLFAITLGAVRDDEQQRRIMDSCHSLLVPGALRTLADRPVIAPVPVEWNGRALHDAHRPYHGRYTGPENETRKPAYHNGTAWTWLFPSWCEALEITFGRSAVPLARRLMGTSASLLRDGCLGQLAEIVDGDPPHRLRGCGAQAWSASEWVRVWKTL